MAPHLQNFCFVYLLDVVAHLYALLHAITLIISSSNHGYFVTTATKIVFNSPRFVLNFYCRQIGNKFNDNGFPHACPGFNAGLDVPNLFPKLTLLAWVLKLIHELGVLPNLKRIGVVVFKKVLTCVLNVEGPYDNGILEELFLTQARSPVLFLFSLYIYIIVQSTCYSWVCCRYRLNLSRLELA